MLAVDDGSSLSPKDTFSGENNLSGPFRFIRKVQVLRLRQNVGHQRAIALGLSWIADNTDTGEVVVMDADGEDDPADVPRLLAKCREEGGNKIVMAIRVRRCESLWFRVCYAIFKLLFVLMTGQPYRMGNFSVIPRRCLDSLVSNSGLWCHYAATVFRSRLPYCGLETNRAKRLDGKSQMNFIGLIMHGLSAIAVYMEVFSVRMIIFCSVLIFFLVLTGIPLGILHFFSYFTVPEWTTAVLTILFVVAFQVFTMVVLLTFITLGNRQMMAFIPIRDYRNYISEAYDL